MKLVNKKVKHVSFGNGKIVKADDNHISIQFDGEEEERSFQYPQAFGKFLKIMDSKIEKTIMKDYEISVEQNKLDLEKMEQARIDAKEKVKEEAIEANKKPKKKPAKKAKKSK
ncbi:hypothetical protein [Gudongella sp. SC589]|jgi:hypothetical protein|uniref:hypothetical protein n=1 Tax=Gudongella sp. SC589 TaxID=3385990 RepID=UPI003904846B